MASTLATKLSVKEIMLLLVNPKKNGSRWNIRTDLPLPNLSWGMLDYEADLIMMNKSGYLTEFEIKRSYSDLCADFKKKIFHNSEVIRQFYYVLPIGIKDKAVALFEEKKQEFFNGRMPAIILYTEDRRLEFYNRGYCANLPGKKRHLFYEERYQIARLCTMRYWSLLEKIYKDPGMADVVQELREEDPPICEESEKMVNEPLKDEALF